MSRTIRRKNAYNLKHHVGRLEEVSDYDLKQYQARSAQDFILKKTAWFHCDNGSGRWSVPYWYCRERNRRVSRENRKEIRRCIRQGDWDDHLPLRFRKDAGYSWW